MAFFFFLTNSITASPTHTLIPKEFLLWFLEAPAIRNIWKDFLTPKLRAITAIAKAASGYRFLSTASTWRPTARRPTRENVSQICHDVFMKTNQWTLSSYPSGFVSCSRIFQCLPLKVNLARGSLLDIYHITCQRTFLVVMTHDWFHMSG